MQWPICVKQYELYFLNWKIVKWYFSDRNKSKITVSLCYSYFVEKTIKKSIQSKQYTIVILQKKIWFPIYKVDNYELKYFPPVRNLLFKTYMLCLNQINLVTHRMTTIAPYHIQTSSCFLNVHVIQHHF